LKVDTNGIKFGQADDTKFKEVLDKTQKFQKQYENAQDIPDAELPDSFDLRNMEGYDFTSGLREQGKCGSCYTMSFS
jgi:hypothetical protein